VPGRILIGGGIEPPCVLEKVELNLCAAA